MIMSSYLHFDKVSFSELHALLNDGREVAHNVVDRDAAGESNTALHVLALLAGEGLLDLLFDEGVDGSAHSGNISAWDGELSSLEQSVYRLPELKLVHPF